MKMKHKHKNKGEEDCDGQREQYSLACRKG